VPPVPGSAFWGWAGPLLVTLFGGFLRFNRLSVPHAVVFDETYYVGDAWAILQHGVEINHVKHAPALLARGTTAILKGGPPRAFRTADLELFHAVRCRFRYSL
jgi:hypothetical protein